MSCTSTPSLAEKLPLEARYTALWWSYLLTGPLALPCEPFELHCLLREDKPSSCITTPLLAEKLLPEPRYTALWSYLSKGPLAL